MGCAWERRWGIRSWHTPVTWVTVRGPLLQQRDGVGYSPQSGLLLSHGLAEGAVGLPGSARDRCRLCASSPPCDRNQSHRNRWQERDTCYFREGESLGHSTPFPGCRRPRGGWERPRALVGSAWPLGTHTSPKVAVSDRLKCARSVDGFLRKQDSPARSPWEEHGLPAPPRGADKRRFFSSSKTTTLADLYFKGDGKICVRVADSRAEAASGGSGVRVASSEACERRGRVARGPPSSRGKALCPPRPSPAGHFPAHLAETPSSCIWCPGTLASLLGSVPARGDRRGTARSQHAVPLTRILPVCSLPSASAPCPWAPTLKVGPWALSFPHIPLLFPLSTSRLSVITSRSALEHSKTMPRGH